MKKDELNYQRNSVFEEINERDLISIKNTKQINILGKVKNPGLISVNKNTTLQDIISKVGGIKGEKGFKAAQVGIPYGHLLSSDDLDKKVDFKNISPNALPQIIVLSREDCIVAYAKFYIEFLINNIDNNNNYCFYSSIDELWKMHKIFEQISKGRSAMQDIFRLRELIATIKKKSGVSQSIIEDIIKLFYRELTEHIEDGVCKTLQCNHLSKLTIMKNCIGCGRCKAVCPVDCIDGTIKHQHKINHSRCTHCGACVSICPVNAITSGDSSTTFLRDLTTPGKTVITQMAPSVRVALGEAFGFPPGENIQNKIAAGLKKLGVDYVFDTAWAADLTIMEEAAELTERYKKYQSGDKSVKLPILTSCCPAWVKFIEQNYGDMLEVPSSAKSPMEMLAAVAKNIWARDMNIPREKIILVAIMPCIAKKYEASRPEFSSNLNYDVDYVITTSELIEIFKSHSIDLSTIKDEPIDPIMGEYTGAGIIFGRTGGVIEAVARTAVEKLTGKRLSNVELENLRGSEDFRSCEIRVDDLRLRIGISHGLKGAKVMLDKIRSGEEFYHAIEIMACMGGCVGGGGQPKLKSNREKIIEQRAVGLNNIDRSKEFRRSGENSSVMSLYEKYLDHPLSHKAEELLHTKYFIKPRH